MRVTSWAALLVAGVALAGCANPDGFGAVGGGPVAEGYYPGSYAGPPPPPGYGYGYAAPYAAAPGYAYGGGYSAEWYRDHPDWDRDHPNWRNGPYPNPNYRAHDEQWMREQKQDANAIWRENQNKALLQQRAQQWNQQQTQAQANAIWQRNQNAALAQQQAQQAQQQQRQAQANAIWHQNQNQAVLQQRAQQWNQQQRQNQAVEIWKQQHPGQ
jgi:hypothetical protein